MNDEAFEKYNKHRKELVSHYRTLKIKAVMLVLGIGVALLAAVILLGVLKLFNIAVVLVLCAVIVMATVIIARMRAVVVNHTAEEKLRQFESEDPTFY